VIRTERLLLRLPAPNDDLTDFVGDGQVQPWIGGGPDETPQSVLELWLGRWERNGIGQFVVELDGELIGRVGFIVWDARTWETSTYEIAAAHAETELGWAILSRHWGHGYATEAALAVLRWGREQGHERIVSLIEPRNVRSVRVADKLGAVPEQLVQTEHGPALVWVHTQ
jgi:RimJ/RimL family protein N-acetyltransferase